MAIIAVSSTSGYASINNLNATELRRDLSGLWENFVIHHLTSIYEKAKTGNRLSLALLINRG